jgi:pilus assembly protein FimV
MRFAARHRASHKACAAFLFALWAGMNAHPTAVAQQPAKGEIRPGAGARAPASQAPEKVKVRKTEAAKPPAKPAAKEGTPIPAAHAVRKGDTLFAIARRTRPEGVTLNQMLLALYRANPEAFLGGNINQLREGHVLRVPPREEVAALDREETDRTVRALLALRPALPPPVAAIKEPPAIPEAVVKPPAAVPPVPRLSRGEAERRYQEGLAMERRGDERGALRAFLEAGESGHGLAQKRLGEIYDKGNSATERDYEASIRWYQKAREQGVELPKPFAFPGGR